ncbi:MAG: hypothetical protein OHK0029_39840 [Armatimonadaceae bacterium]
MPNLRSFAALTAATAAVVLSIGAARAENLEISSPAPAVKVAKFVKGTPANMVKSGDSYTFKPGTIHVVEFWATWCGPCRVSIPHITELAQKYKDKITVTGVSISEGDPAYLAKVEKFVNEMGDKMAYNVAVDTEPQGGFMAKNWMDAAGQNGIPTAFIVGKDGKIAWIGHPMAMDKPLAEIVAGTYNASAAAEQMKKEKAEEARVNELGKVVNDRARQGDFKGAVAAIDAFKTEDEGMKARLAMVKVQLMSQYDEPGALQYVTSLSDGMFKDDPMSLNELAWSMVGDEPQWKKPDYALALKLARRAAELTKNQEPPVLDTLAMAYYRAGNLGQAITTQKQAIALLDKAKADAATRKEYTNRLEMFEKKKP